MKTKLTTIIVIMIVCISMTSMVSATNFLDVHTDNIYYNAIIALNNKGIINGYEDGTFRPNGYITRAEAAAIIVRAAELPTSSLKSIYSDVSEEHWSCGYIMAATNAGIINGMGNGIFSADGEVTYNQILKMIVCMMGLEDKAVEQGGWPTGYIEVAYMNDIINTTIYGSINYDGIGNYPATRQDVAYFLYNAISFQENNTLYVEDRKYTIGMTVDCLETPDEILASTGNFKWYVYGTDTYQTFYSVGVDENKIVALASTGKGFNYSGYKCGDIQTDKEGNFCIYTDSNDSNIIHSVLILDDVYGINFSEEQYPTSEQLLGESKMNFHFTNAFRVFHKLKPFKWSDKAAKSAQLHSEDMAKNNYFSHSNLNGLSSAERISKQGINWSSCAENIAAGNSRYLGFHSFNGWVNSSGHRKNMLSYNTYLGVGIAYNPNSYYNYYHTQNFFSAQ